MKASPSVWIAFLAVLVAGCDTTSPAPQRNLDGPWTFSFAAIDTATCPLAPPDFVQGCGGGGTLELEQQGPFLGGRWTVRGGCQSCGLAADFANSGELEAMWSLSTLDFEIQGFRFLADVPAGDVETITGTVSCPWDDGIAQGTWTMTRSP